jgi:hypothetical protein
MTFSAQPHSDNILLLHFGGKPTMDCSILVLHIYSRDARVRACREKGGKALPEG